MLKMSHQMGDEVAAVPRQAELKILGMEFGMMAGVGAVPFRAALLHCMCHAKEGAAMGKVKAPPPGQSSRGYSSHATLSAGQDQLTASIFTHLCQDL